MPGPRSVLEARDQVLSEGVVPDSLAGVVRPDILQSWRRSLISGAHPEQASLQYCGDAAVRTRLLEAAEPVLSGLADQMGGLEGGLLLADREANIVRRWVADPALRSLLDRINSDVGFNVGEDSIGTNGVGTVIESGTAVQISGPEHLALALSRFTCVGVPVLHPVTRRLEGIITLSCRAEAGNPLLTPLMTSTARDIERRLLDQASVRERRLLDAYVFATSAWRGPVAVVGRDLLIAGPQVTELLGDVDQATLWEYVRSAAVGSRDVPGGFAPERFGIVRCKPVENERAVIGAVVEFDLERRGPRERSGAGAAPVASAAIPLAMPGRSTALAATVSRTTRLVVNGAPIVVVGEPGVGKYTLATAALTAAGVADDRRAIVDAAESAVDPAALVEALGSALDGDPSALLIRHLEAAGPEAAAAAAAFLERRSVDPGLPQVIATLTPADPYGDPVSPGLRRLVDTLGASMVTVPPLRERREDIGEAAAARLTALRGPSATIAPAALRTLMRAPWPGNLRQLDGVVRAAVERAPAKEIRLEDLPQELQVHATRRDLSAIEELEYRAIVDALARHGGNKQAAAQAVGLSRSTLYRKLRAYRIDADRQYF